MTRDGYVILAKEGYLLKKKKKFFDMLNILSSYYFLHKLLLL